MMPIYLNSASRVQTTEITKKTAPGHSAWHGIARSPIAHNAPPQIDENTYRNSRIIGADFIVRTRVYRANQAPDLLMPCSRLVLLVPHREPHVSPSKKAIVPLSHFLAPLNIVDVQTCSHPVDMQKSVICKGDQEKKGKQQKPGKQKEREGDKGSQRIKKQKGK